MRPKPFVMIVLDGVGLNPSEKGNALKLASTPNFDSLWEKYPHTKLKAHGRAVGLERGYIGGSEVGHLHMNAGRVVDQELKTINDAIRSGKFFKNEAFLKAIKHVKRNASRLHLIGLLSDGGVHSDIGHLYALLKLAREHGIYNVFIHAFLDGRDVGPRSANRYLAELEAKIGKELRVGKVATIMGRAYAMDRTGRWSRTKKAYDLLFRGKGVSRQGFSEGVASIKRGESIRADPVYAVEKFYKQGFKDEYFPPMVFDEDAMIRDEDAVIDFNFRADRARQLVGAIVGRFHFQRKSLIALAKKTRSVFSGFKRKKSRVLFVGMTPYSEKLKTLAAFAHPYVKNTLGEVISRAGLKQLRIAETEKFVHVTFFSNGDSDVRYASEDRICVPSLKVKTYDLRPAMSAPAITKRLLRELWRYDFVLVNFANGDMVGHTGNLGAAVKGLEVVDGCLGRLVKEIKELCGEAVILADHGNCDEMGPEITNHSKYPVPFIVVTDRRIKLRQKGNLGLTNVAPTVLQMMRLKKPAEMTAGSLIKK